MLDRLKREPPFRLLAQAFYRRFGSTQAKADFDAVPYPGYLIGLMAAARQAKEQGVSAFTAMELGVAGGNGLVALEQHAIRIWTLTGVAIHIQGFDHGTGMPPANTGDHRDHLDHWQGGDYPMNERALRKRLQGAHLHLGPLSETIPTYLEHQSMYPPLGFVAIDVDWYSSTTHALQLFGPQRSMLRRTYVYLDDVNYRVCHKFAGELLAVDEFNDSQAEVKIDRMRNLSGRVFPDADWIEKMYVAHDLAQIDAAGNQARAPRQFALET